MSDNGDLKLAGRQLLLASLLVLFQELALIRWLPGQVRVLAYFPNVVLISAFLGLGLGCLLRGRRSFLIGWPFLLLVLICSAIALSRVAFTSNSESEHLWLLYYDLPENAPVIQTVALPILGFFFLSALSFIPLGQFVAERLQIFRQSGIPLKGYVFDLGGSLCGVIAFSLLGYFHTSPIVWFSALLSIAVLIAPSRRVRWSMAAMGSLVLILIWQGDRATFYSPYYALHTTANRGEPGVSVLTNGSLHQIALKLRQDDHIPQPLWQNVRQGYHLPYRQLNFTPERALVLGAGTGNDVAVMLDEGVKEIDAVEIDPVIAQLGRTIHPDKPYSSERVTLHVTDARSFLNSTDKRYDLIVFGTLDSMTRLSALSNVRLDNFVYTAESIETARRLLTPRGGIAMYFSVGTNYIDRRLAGLLTQAFGEIPLVSSQYYQMFNRIYMAGPAFAHHGQNLRIEAANRIAERAGYPSLDLPTDDWPFLYLARKTLTPFYLTLMAGIFFMAVIGVACVSRRFGLELMRGRGIDVAMFLFGFAFLLLETKAVTDMNLVWGATWVTSAVVFSSILLTILLATVLAEPLPLSFGSAMPLLAAGLLVNYLVPAGLLPGLSIPLKFIASMGLIGAPIFFAGICFAEIYRLRERVDLAFGWNILGAVAGGLTEITSMVIGLRSLALVALLAYLLAYLSEFSSAKRDAKRLSCAR